MRLPTEIMNFKKRSMYLPDIKPSFASNTTTISSVHTERDANLFTRNHSLTWCRLSKIMVTWEKLSATSKYSRRISTVLYKDWSAHKIHSLMNSILSTKTLSEDCLFSKKFHPSVINKTSKWIKMIWAISSKKKTSILTIFMAQIFSNYRISDISSRHSISSRIHQILKEVT